MTISIQQVSISDQLNLCNQMQIDIFHHELQLFGMKIPDDYDQFSVYMQVQDSDAVVGTYRIVLPNPSLGLPIEESGFDLKQFDPHKVCEMSRLVLLKEKRGKIPFSKIFSSACRVAKQHDASILLVAILPRNFLLFKRYGFSQVGPPLSDPSVESNDTEEAVVIPMEMHL
ncbi:MAG: GNAT family N-acetyltransferase [Hormoscilla sp.]